MNLLWNISIGNEVWSISKSYQEYCEKNGIEYYGQTDSQENKGKGNVSLEELKHERDKQIKALNDMEIETLDGRVVPLDDKSVQNDDIRND